MKKIADKKILDCGEEISRSVFNYMKKKMEREVSKISNANKINVNDAINVSIIALASLDINILVMLRNSFKINSGAEIDFQLLLDEHQRLFSEMLNIEKDTLMKEKMN